MRLKDRYAGIVGWFKQNTPVAQSELHFRNPYELIVSVVLSAQCTDKRVNAVTPALFEAFPGPEELGAAATEEILAYIRSVSYPNSKALHLKGLGQKLCSDFGGRVPGTIDELMTLPGVGRKTANVVASIVYDEPVIAVDTHVFRVSRRLGLSKGRTPREVELDLEKHIAPADRPVAHHWLILHGRYTCTARAPKCTGCGLQEWCEWHKKHAED